jgi:hypothetical protein
MNILFPEKIKEVVKKVLGIRDYKTKREKIFGFSLRFLIVISLVFILISQFLPAKFFQQSKVIKEPEKKKLTIEMAKKDFNANEDLEFLVKEQKEEKAPSSSEIKPKLQASLVNNATGKEVLTTPIIEKVSDSDFKIKIQKPEDFRPGVYKLKVEYNGKVAEQEFNWGVLAINTNKSVYSPGEEAYLQMASLNEYGHARCNSKLELKITNSTTGAEESFSTQDGTIQKNGTCNENGVRDNVTDSPDYFAYYQVSQQGTYQMQLTNLDTGYEITDSFEVKENVPFDIERIGATRINPYKSTYRMTLNIKANQDFDGEAVEKLPSGFKVTNAGGGAVNAVGEEKEIVWKLQLKKGEQKTLQYEYQAPEVSPQLFLLGPAEMRENSIFVFQESRRWQIASDVTCAIIMTSSVNWSAHNWGTCDSSNYPGYNTSGDDVTITASSNSARTLTLDVDITSYTIGTITINYNSSYTSRVVTLDMTSHVMTTTGNVTINGSSSANDVLSFSTGATGKLTVGGNMVKGSYGTISFGGTTAGTLNLIGSLDAVGTFTKGVGTVQFSSTAAQQTIPSSYSYYNIKISNTYDYAGGDGVILNGTTAIGGTLVIDDGASLSASAGAMTVTGATTVGGGSSGKLIITSNSYTQTFTGAITIATGAALTESAAATLSFGNNVTITGTLTENGAATVGFAGNLTNNGTYTASTGVHTFTGTTKIISGSSTVIIPSLTISGTTTNNGTLTVNTALAGASALTNGASATLNIGGTSLITTLTPSGAGNTVNYTADSQTVHSNTYVNLTLSGSGTDVLQIGTTAITGALTLSGTVTTTTVVNITSLGSLSVGDGCTLNLAAFNTTVTGATTVGKSDGTGTSGTLNITSTTGTHAFTGAVTIYNHGTLAESAAEDLTFSSDVTINSGGTLTENGAATVGFAGNLTNNGTYTASTGTHTFTSTTGALSGTISIPTATFSGTGCAYANSGTFTSATLLTVTSPAVLTNNGTITATAALSGNGGLTQGSSGILNIGGTSGITTLNTTAGTNTVNYTKSDGGQSIRGMTYVNLTLGNGSGTDTVITANLVVNGTLITTAGGILDMTAAYTLSGTLGTITNNGTISTAVPTATSNAPIKAGQSWGGTIIYAATTGLQTVVNGTYNSLTLSNTGVTTDTATAGSILTVNGALVTGSGIFDMSTSQLLGSLTSITNNGIIKTSNTSATPIPTGKSWGGTIEYGASNGAQTVVAGTYTTLTLDNSTGTNTAGGDLSITTLNTTASGTLDMGTTNRITAVTTATGSAGIIKTSVPTSTSSTPIPTGKSWGGTIEYGASNGAQTVVAGTYTTLTLDNSTGTNTAGGDLSITTLNTTASGTLDMGTTNRITAVTTATGSAGIIKTSVPTSTSATPIPTGKSWGGTIEYGASNGAQTVVAGTYNNLTLSNTSGTNTAGGAITVSATFTTTAGGTLDMVTYALSVSTVSHAGILKTQNTTATPLTTGKTWAGTVQYDADGGQTVVTGTYNNLTLSTSGTKTMTGVSTINGNLTLLGTAQATTGANTTVGGNITVGTGAYLYVAAGYTLDVTGSVAVTSTGSIYNTSTDGFTIFTDLTGTGGLTQGTNAVLNVAGTVSITHLAAVDNVNTVNYTGVSQTVKAGNYYNLTLSGSGTPVLTGVTLEDPGNLTLSGTVSVSTSGDVYILGGDIIVGTGTHLTVAAANTLDVYGSVSVTSTGTITNNSTDGFTIYTDLTGNGGLTQGTNAVLNVAGTVSITSLTATASPNTVNYTGAGQTVKAVSYYNLTLSGSATPTLTGLTTINGNFLLSGTVNPSTAVNLAVGGNLQINNNNTLTIPSTYTLSVTGTTTVTGSLVLSSTAAGGHTFDGDVTISVTTGVWNNSGNTIVSFDGSLANNNSFTAGSGVQTFTGTSKTISGTVSIPSLTISGAVQNNGTLTVSTALAGADTLTNGIDATLNIGGTSSITTLTATASGNTVVYNGSGISQTIKATAYYHLTLSNTAGVSLNSNASAAGNLTVDSGVTLTSAAGVIISGDGTLTGNGTVQVTRTATTADFSSQYTITNPVLSNLTVEYVGTAAQTISALTYGNLKINNSNGATLGGNATVDGTLTLTSGNITTDTNSVIISSTGSVSRTSGHIIGNLQKYTATGATSKTFEIGDSDVYAPVAVTFGNVSVAGNLTAKTTDGDHSDIASSGIDSTKSVNRYWTMTNSGITFTNYSATFTFVAGDIDPGADWNIFIVAKKDGSWVLPTVGTRTSTSTQATGMTSFSEYQLGEEAPTITITGTVYQSEGGSNIGSGKTIALRIDGLGSYSDATDGSGIYEITGLTGISAGSTITVWIDGDAINGTTVTIANDDTSDITGLHIYGGVIIVRSDKSATAITIDDMVDYDSDQELDGDIEFDADSGSPDTLNVLNTSELHIWTGKSFSPGGTVTTSPGGAKGDIHIDDSAVFTAGGAISCGGSWTADTGTTFTHNNNTVTFTATASGKTITTNSQSFYDLIFNGSSGEWTPQAAVAVANNLTTTVGTLLGTQDVAVSGGAITGTNGSITLTGGTVTLSGTGNLGPSGSGTYSFSSLTLSGTTTAVGDFTVSSVLTISDTYSLDASSKTITLSGTTGTPFVKTGTFTANASTVQYTGNCVSSCNTNVVSTTYYNLYLNNGSETYDAAGNITVSSVFTINAGTFDAKATTLTLSGTGTPFVNSGTFTASNSTVEYTGTTTTTNITAVRYNNLILTPSASTTYNLAGDLTGTKSLTGTLTINSNAILDAVSGSNYDIALAGDWTNNGSFTARNGTATFSGADSSTQKIQGSANTSFYDFTASTSGNSLGRTLQFKGGSTTIVSGTWTITGYSGKVIILESSDTNSWTINPTAASVTYVNVSRSTNTGVYFCATYSTNGGNNSSWAISSSSSCGKYLTSCWSGLTNSCSDDSYSDDVIGALWHRSDPTTMWGSKDYDGLNYPPLHGSWYAGMLLSGIEVTINGTSISFAELTITNNFSNTASTQTEIIVTTGSNSGYIVTAWETQVMTHDDYPSEHIDNFKVDGTDCTYPPAGTCTWPEDENCTYDNKCGFGFTSDDDNVEGGNPYGGGTKFAGFPDENDPARPILVMDWPSPVSGKSFSITYRISTLLTQRPGTYGTTIVYVVTAQY